MLVGKGGAGTALKPCEYADFIWQLNLGAYPLASLEMCDFLCVWKPFLVLNELTLWMLLAVSSAVMTRCARPGNTPGCGGGWPLWFFNLFSPLFWFNIVI